MDHALCRPSERITMLNVLSGLVLLGLLIAQVFDHQQTGNSLPLNDHHPDLPAQFVVQLLVAGQFDRMGSFGIGLFFYRCWQRAEPSGQGPGGSGLAEMVHHRIARRLWLLLLGIGLVLS